MTTRAVRRRLAVAVLACSATVLTACGTDLAPEVHPGSAAVVGDERITLDEVDDLADGLCHALLPQLEAAGQVFPMARVRAMSLTSLLIDGELSRRFAEDHEVEISDEVLAQQRALPQQFEAEGFEGRDLEVAVEFTERGIYHQFVVTEVARRELGNDVTDSTLAERGEEIFAEWAETQDYEVDPRFGTLDPLEGSVFRPGEPGLSVPVSDSAIGSAAGEDDTEVYGAHVDELPAAQRCGEPAVEAPPPNPLAP